jgi:hypothetical protein
MTVPVLSETCPLVVLDYEDLKTGKDLSKHSMYMPRYRVDNFVLTMCILLVNSSAGLWS